MKERIGSLSPDYETISDLSAIFRVIYNVLSEKVEEEPKRGIILSKGNLNQRKVTWREAIELAHMLEDYFSFRKQLIGNHVCENCRYWSSISKVSPHMGCCHKRKKEPIHRWYTCKKFEEVN